MQVPPRLADLAGTWPSLPIPRPRLRTVAIVGFTLWLALTIIDLFTVNFGTLKPLPAEGRKTERHLLLLRPAETTEPVPTPAAGRSGEEEQFQSWLAGQQQLRQHIQKVCSKAGPTLHLATINQREFLWEEEHELLFCRNAKVGTTTWLTHFLALANSTAAQNVSSKNVHKIVPKMFLTGAGVDIQLLAQTSTSFSMVRHPFERLVSAYQDKMVDASDRSYFRVRDFIIKNYGKITFPNFIMMILKKSRTKCRRVSSCKLDKHWKPFISRCGYCDVPYQVIGRAETFEQDQRGIGRLAGVAFPPMESHSSSGGSTRELAVTYFSSLQRDTVLQLYHLYRPDFELFGYSPDKYLQLAISKS